ncbi:peroxiredoxin Q/BCP [Sphingomonas jinjuensis]|uniref:thioredoxin-dependent peroxiredoxin n=1 Tax=Sphingomonas jinjuensis TaxID=535907 RepID=A0A840FFR9_9SPHN|nr:peroxiredoxin [Sphingomonas jinjuensis]MBB4154487.1 peroxiredoxin Q/BCP [Sphingomonas jinjuensis]
MDEGTAMPAVTVTGVEGTPLRLTDLPLPAAIYFYPKDDTSGCTREAQDFTALGDAFAALGCSVLGISKDSPASHAKFAAKHALGVTLASDGSGAACDAFGVWGEKSMYGRTYMGIERATFLFDAEGKLARAWRKVRVPGHAEAVLEAAKGL